MTGKDAISNSLDMSDFIIGKYLEDLSDSDLLVRPVPGMNHIAWQVGHLLSAERAWTELLKPGSAPELPAGFDAAHGKETIGENDPAKFLPAAKYRELLSAQRAATRAVLASVADSDLDAAKPGLPDFAPTPGKLLNMVAIHMLMHVGQFVAVRRQLGKPVTI